MMLAGVNNHLFHVIGVVTANHPRNGRGLNKLRTGSNYSCNFYNISRVLWGQIAYQGRVCPSQPVGRRASISSARANDAVAAGLGELMMFKIPRP